VGMEDFFNTLPRLIWHEDEPLAWPSSVSLYFVSRLASKHVKVVLTGEGSDELFAGYGRYGFYLWNQRFTKAYRRLPGAWRERIRSAVASSSLLSAPVRRKLQHSFIGRGEELESLYLDNFFCAFSRAEQDTLLADGDVSTGQIYREYRRYWDSAADRTRLEQMLYADQKTYLVELLMKQDQMSMACSIESRVPFLDHPFVEFASRVPEGLKIRGGEAKYILKRAVEDLLPKEIIYRKKMGFPTPLRQWLLDSRADALYELLEERDGLIVSYCDMARVRTLIERHREGLEDATDRIWRLVNLQLWGDLFLAGRRERWWEGVMARAAA